MSFFPPPRMLHCLRHGSVMETSWCSLQDVFHPRYSEPQTFQWLLKTTTIRPFPAKLLLYSLAAWNVSLWCSNCCSFVSLLGLLDIINLALRRPQEKSCSHGDGGQSHHWEGSISYTRGHLCRWEWMNDHGKCFERWRVTVPNFAWCVRLLFPDWHGAELRIVGKVEITDEATLEDLKTQVEGESTLFSYMESLK